VASITRIELANYAARPTLSSLGALSGNGIKIQRSTALDVAVGVRIRNLRLRNRLSQTDLGEQVGVTFQQIQKYEKGTSRVSAGRLAQLAKVFSVPIVAFYSDAPTSKGRATKRANNATVDDTNVDRLVKAFQALKDKKLKAAMLRAAEEMVRLQPPKTRRGGAK
jgi:transcriptional regulator with XRE-family HTH domain